MNSPQPPLTVLECFAHCAEHYAERIAVRYLDEKLSYQELDQKSDAFARRLQLVGVRQGEYVGIFSEQRLELPVALLGILKVGAAYAPLDSTQPEERLRFMVADADIRVVISSNPKDSRYTQTLLDYDQPQLSDSFEPLAVSQDSVAALMYTSGTTGVPKGVMVPHRGICRLVIGDTFMHLGKDQVWLQHTRVGFDASHLEIWGPLLNGAEMVVLPAEELSFRSLDEAIKKYNVTATNYTAGLFHAIVDAAPENLSALQQLMVSGDVISPERCKKVMEMAPDLTLYNGYGPTENSAFTTVHKIEFQDLDGDSTIPIGKPVNNTEVFVVDEDLNIVPDGETGELVCAGLGLTLGYLNQADLTAEKFITAPWDKDLRIYRIGDLGRLDKNGNYIFEGRIDTQVKVRGYRVELGEIENALEQHADIQQAIVLAKSKSDQTDKTLIAFYTLAGDAPDKIQLQQFLKPKLPEFAVPTRFTAVDAIPLNANGKVDRRQLLTMLESSASNEKTTKDSNTTNTRLSGRRQIIAVVEEILELDKPRLNDSFMDMGASSIEIAKIHELLQQRLEREFPVTDMFKHSSIAKLANHLGHKRQPSELNKKSRLGDTDSRIAIVGLSGRFPGADNVETFWQNLLAGKDTIKRFSPEELELEYHGEDYVLARGVIDGALDFDAAHFGLPPREADVIDPQHRIMLECAQQALENAAHNPETFAGNIGVFAGCSTNTYIYNNVFQDPDSLQAFFTGLPLSNVTALIGNDKDYITTRIAHKLNLTGPAVNVQSACSTSLLAVATACDSLRSGQSDMALAGGVTVSFPQHRGYVHTPGAITSEDGHCRPFDNAATGTVFGEGAGMVVLRRLDDAIADDDHIIAVISGYAVNNDGSDKAGFTAPGVRGQVDVIKAAQQDAGIAATEVGYIEAHGTGTPLGDPIEIAALAEAFEASAGGKAAADCMLGSVKANVGHLESASGISGLIKTALVVQRNEIPPLINFQQANEKIDFAKTPFVPVTEKSTWSQAHKKRIAGVSSFGFGGTNVHVVLEQPPEPVKRVSSDDDKIHLLPLSASSPKALAAQQQSIAQFLENNPKQQIGDVAYTLQQGRQHYGYRTAVTGRNATELINGLEKPLPATKAELVDEMVFMFPGQGAQHIGMGQALYKKEAVFTVVLEECVGILKANADIDLLSILFAADKDQDAMQEKLRDTAIAQPAIFCISYALAKQWQAWGVKADYYIGHSIGEFVAATLAGIFTLKDALELISLRGSLMSDLPSGAMLSVRCSEVEIQPLLSADLDLAVVNGPELCVVAGPDEKIDDLVATLEERGLSSSKLHTSHAFHSKMMAPAIEPFTKKLESMNLQPPQKTIVSTVTGSEMDAATATSVGYWAEHILQAVRFDDAIGFLQEQPGRVYLEVGPGSTLTTLATARAQGDSATACFSSSPHVSQSDDALHYLHQTFARLWAAGYPIDWQQQSGRDRKISRRIVLPSYPFQRKRHWVEPTQVTSISPQSANDVFSDVVDEDVAGHANPSAALSEAQDISESSLAEKITLLLSELSGYGAEQIVANATFLELGFDSLLLTQACKEFNREFSVQLTLRQLIDEYSSVDALADYLQQQNVRVALAQKQSKDIELHVEASETSAPVTRINKSDDSDLNKNQRAFIDELVERYTAKTITSKQKTAEHRSHYADPRTASGFNRLWKEMVYQIISVKSQGSRLLDIDGNEYIDLLNGFGPGFFGHSPDFLVDAIRDQLEDGFEVGPQSLAAMESAELFCRLTGTERASFVCTGSEAVQAVMRIARTVTARDKIVVFSRDYHGNFDEVLVRSVNNGGKLKTLPLAPGIPNRAVDDIIVLPYGTDESLQIIKEYAHQLAGVVVEPVQSRRPEFQPHEFIRELRDVTRASGSLLIFDEVITGLRLGPGGAQALYGVEADLATYGKVIAGGMPIGVVAGKARYMDTFDGGQWQYGDNSFPDKPVTFFAGTFVRHPLAMAAIKSVLQYLLEKPPIFWKKISAKANRLAQSVNQNFKNHGVPLQMVNCGSIMFVRVLDNHPYANLLFFLLREKGVFILEGFPCYVTEAHSEEEIDYVIDAFAQSLNELMSVGFFDSEEKLSAASFAATHMTPPAMLSLQVDMSESEQSLSVPIESTIFETPSSEAQREIWLALLINEDATRAYNESIGLSFNGEMHGQHLREALAQTFNRHDSLRSTFSEDGTLIRIHEEMQFDIKIDDCTDLDEHKLNQRLAEIRLAEVDTQFDLKAGPYARGRVIQKGAKQWEVIITTHHIVCDGWSIDLLIRDFADAYNAIASEESLALPHPTSIIDYIEREQQWQGSKAYDQAEAFWLDTFADEIPVLDLPVDKPRPAHKTSNGARFDAVLDPQLMAGLKKVGIANGSSLVNILLASLKLYLYRLTGQSDITVALPSAGQAARGMNDLIGHCVNLLPVRSKLEAESSFSDFLNRLRGEFLDCVEHQFYGYGTLAKNLRHKRDPSRPFLAPVSFNLDNGVDFSSFSFRGVQPEFESLPRTHEHFEWFLNVVENEDQYILEWSYNTDLFEDASIARHIENFQRLLADIVANPNDKLDEYSLHSGDVLVQQKRRYEETIAEYPSGTLHQLIEQRAAEIADHRAVIIPARGKNPDQYFSHGEINAKANKMARGLQAAGVGSGDLIGICLPRNESLIPAILAILKLGAAYVPLDPGLPPERIALMVSDSGAKLIISESSLSAVVESSGAELYFIDSRGDEFEKLSDKNLSVDIPAEQTAYIIYTSGSTGQPKGVRISHCSVVNFLTSMMNAPGFSSADRILALTTISFDISVLEICLPLLAGGQMLLASREDAYEPRRIIDYLDRYDLTMMQATPSTYRMLLEYGWRGRAQLQVNCGGEALTSDLVSRLLPTCKSVWNMYGPTEVTVCTLVKKIESENDKITIGKPIANTEALILDKNMRPVSTGVAGELYLGGDGLALGYLNRPALDKERFVPHPFPYAENKLLYRTGDLARRDANEEIECLGRVDDQVKIRGYRIELGEVESTLLQQAAVSAAAVICQDSGSAEARLLAWVVPTSGAVFDESKLREALLSTLPEYMLPSRIIEIDEIPLTGSGKLDKNALPKIEDAQRFDFSECTPVEKELLNIWSSVLKVGAIDVDANFFELGGHSLMAVRMFNIVKKEFGSELPIATLFENPTIRLLAKKIVAAGPIAVTDIDADWDTTITIHKGGNGSALFVVGGVGGNVNNLFEFGQAFGQHRPLVGVQTRGVMGHRPHESIEAMATEHIRYIQLRQPHGPYLIAGFSGGGLTAFEIARQLKAMGEDVGFLGLIDTDAPNFNPPLEKYSANPIVAVQKIFQRIKRDGLKVKLMSLPRKILPQRFFDWIDSRGNEDLSRFMQLMERWELAAEKYQGGTFQGDMTLFRSAPQDSVQDAIEAFDPLLGWQSSIDGNITAVHSSVGHLEMIADDQAVWMAEKMLEAIAACE